MTTLRRAVAFDARLSALDMLQLHCLAHTALSRFWACVDVRDAPELARALPAVCASRVTCCAAQAQPLRGFSSGTFLWMGDPLACP